MIDTVKIFTKIYEGFLVIYQHSPKTGAWLPLFIVNRPIDSPHSLASLNVTDTLLASLTIPKWFSNSFYTKFSNPPHHLMYMPRIFDHL